MCRPAMTVRIRDLIRSNRLFAAILGLRHRQQQVDGSASVDLQYHPTAKQAGCPIVNGFDRQVLTNGTVATKSGLGSREFGPHELYTARRPFSSTAPTATNSGPSAGKAMLPRSVNRSSQPPRMAR